MDHTRRVRKTLAELNETQKLVMEQIERVRALRSANVSTVEAEKKLMTLYAKLPVLRAKYLEAVAAAAAHQGPRKLAIEGAGVGGPRWRIGWGGLM